MPIKHTYKSTGHWHITSGFSTCILHTRSLTFGVDRGNWPYGWYPLFEVSNFYRGDSSSESNPRKINKVCSSPSSIYQQNNAKSLSPLYISSRKHCLWQCHGSVQCCDSKFHKTGHSCL